MPKINQTVLMSDAQHFSTEFAINPYYSSAADLNAARAQSEHESIKAAFLEAGISVISVPSPSSSQDGVYTANWALTRRGVAVIASLPDIRKSEEAYATNILQKQGYKIVTVPEGLHFSGQGDALPCGDYLFCGMGYRSDEAAQQFAAKTLGYKRIQVQAVPYRDKKDQALLNPVTGWPDSFFYDIDLAISIIRAPEKANSASDTGGASRTSDTDRTSDDGSTDIVNTAKPGLIAYCPEALTPESVEALESLPDIETIHVSLHEAEEKFACNLVSTGETVIMGDGAPELKQNLEAHGLRVVTPHIDELSKGGGYIRCTSLTLG